MPHNFQTILEMIVYKNIKKLLSSIDFSNFTFPELLFLKKTSIANNLFWKLGKVKFCKQPKTIIISVFYSSFYS